MIQTITELRNSRTAVKRAKLEHSKAQQLHTFSSEKKGMIHQIVNADRVKMNCVFIDKNVGIKGL